MIPLKDDVPCKQTPYVNYLMMSICTLVFGLQVWAGGANQELVERMGMVPARVMAEPGEAIFIPAEVLVQSPFGLQVMEGERALNPALVPEWLTLVTCVFLHGGWLHFLGNMWFLVIFGDNVEDRLGHAVFAALYVGTGIVASLFHLVFNLDSTIPTIGASGAIAGVMGAYLYMFPYSRVVTIVPLIFLWPVVVLPAPIFLVIWFVLQFWNGAFATISGDVSGVAWWAHIGGFVAGLASAAAIGGPPASGIGAAESMDDALELPENHEL